MLAPRRGEGKIGSQFGTSQSNRCLLNQALRQAGGQGGTRGDEEGRGGTEGTERAPVLQRELVEEERAPDGGSSGDWALGRTRSEGAYVLRSQTITC